MIISTLKKSNYDQWLPLWNANCLNQISDEVTEKTWQRLCYPKKSVHGLGAFDGDILQGFLHYILHPTTGFTEPTCYMQDLYVCESARRQGIAKRLVWELHAIGKAEKWARIYWFSENNNVAAQNLYKNLGIPINFSLHMLQTQ